MKNAGNSASRLIAMAALFASGGVSLAADAKVMALSGDGLWTRWSELPAAALRDAQGQATESWIRPEKSAPVSLDLVGMARMLETAPMEFTQAARQRPVVISLPMPDGSFQRFNVVQSPIMEPGLQAQFPHIRTYSGVGIEDPWARVRFDLTDLGFRAQILRAGDAVYIDPVTRGDTTHYVSYLKADYRKPGVGGFGHRCLVPDMPGLPPLVGMDGELDNFGADLRNYRLAVATTGEYTSYYGGTVSGALSGVTTSVNRITGIYERDLAVRLTLVANNNLLISTNASTDPWNNNDVNQMWNAAQGVIDGAIGSTNYDVGHVFASANTGGVAALRSVCVSGSKARGVSGSFPPIGDPYDVDYVAHELGHQFGGNHTFNNCGGAGPLPAEPGSGVTIMAYAGICGATNIANNSIPSFHSLSILSEMRSWVTGGGSCGTLISTGNTIPTVDAGLSYSIPARTPFILTMSGSDANGDALTYQWEQNDISGSPANLGIDPGTGPIIRSDAPTTSPVRIVPALTNLLNNTVRSGEILPTTNRFLNFRAIVRDGRGGYITGLMRVTSVASDGSGAVGPFRVTSPNTNVAWPNSSTQTVTWDVAGTNRPSVGTTNVVIELSTDGGQTWPINLGTFPNNGSAQVTLPSGPVTTTARLRVRAAGNIYFDISDVNFRLVAPPCYVNCDGSNVPPILNSLDFACFLFFYQQGDPYANCDGSTTPPVLNALDFSCFLSRYVVGCP